MANNLVFEEIFDVGAGSGGSGGDTGGGASIELDTTLTQEGKAADAKATGDAIDSVDKKCDAIIGHFSEGLAYTLKDDGTYEVSGIGTCIDTDIIIPSVVDGYRVTSIGEYAFQSCTALRSVIIPNSVTIIGKYAFYNCMSIIDVTIPDSVTRIDEQAFKGCASLISVTIPNSVHTIGDAVFEGCSSLTTVIIGDHVRTISFSLFKSCRNLESITIPNGVMDIGPSAFYSCNSLKSITIPDSVTDIGQMAFIACVNLTSITIPNSVTSIGSRAFNGCPSLTIYCETESKPEGWNYSWNPDYCPTYWGVALDFINVNKKILNCATTEYVDGEIAIAASKMTSVTYSELKALRDNYELIPGMFYRITDYVCTTSQVDTRAMNNRFDIIVQALSTSTLSENASADYHLEEGVVEGVTFKPSVVSDDTMLVEGSVTPYYYEYIDFNGPEEGMHEYKQTDVFIAYDYLENNNGVIVPVIYKTDEVGLGDEPDPEFKDPDYKDVFYYVGTGIIDSVTYDKWRKIEIDGNGELTWDSVGKAYLYTNIITDVQGGGNTGVTIRPDVANIPAWEIKYCLDNDTTRFAWADTRVIVEDGLNSNEIYRRYPSFDGSDEQYGDAGYYFCWRSETSENDVFFSKAEQLLPYEQVAFYGIGERFITTASVGRGVIYYMKDEHGNECPYDFKNIQFKRMISLENGYPELDEENGEETWVYTFCGNSYHSDNDEWSELKDGSLESPYRHQSDEGGSTFHHNIIRPYIKVYDEENEDYLQCGKIYLNNNVFLGYWDEIGSDSGNECPFYYGSCCFNNTFGENCYNNTFGHNCNNNTFGRNCRGNRFEAYCIRNRFGIACFDNVFGENSSHNTFGDECSYNTIAVGFYNNTFGNFSSSNRFGTYCQHNTFGNDCYSITINGDNVKYIEVGSGVNSVQITPEPNKDYQQIYRKSGSKEILI